MIYNDADYKAYLAELYNIVHGSNAVAVEVIETGHGIGLWHGQSEAIVDKLVGDGLAELDSSGDKAMVRLTENGINAAAAL